MTFTPAELAQADQELAAYDRHIDELVTSARCAGRTVETIDELSRVLRARCNVDTLAVALAVTIHRLAETTR